MFSTVHPEAATYPCEQECECAPINNLLEREFLREIRNICPKVLHSMEAVKEEKIKDANFQIRVLQDKWVLGKAGVECLEGCR